MDVAEVIGRRSQCARKQVGALIIDGDNRIIASGYNGFPRGFDGVCDREAQEQPAGNARGFDCPMVHAEANALLFADRRDVEHGTMYITAVPCEDCAKLIANSGIARVVVAFNTPIPARTVDIFRFFAQNAITAFIY